MEEEIIDEIEIIGTFKPSPKGFGFLMQDNEKKLMINFGQLKKIPLFNGDIVKAKAYFSIEENRYKLISYELIDAPKRELVGTCVAQGEYLLFMPELSYLNAFPIKIGTKVTSGERLKIRAVTDERNNWVAQPLEVLGTLQTKNIESLLSISENNIPITFRPESIDAINSCIQKGLQNAEKQSNRIDYTNLKFVTIDGESTLDVDDAIYVEKKKNGNFKLYVAIADVAQFVEKDSNLDKDAIEHGTSIYFIQGTIPMLPRKLSEDACSLLPNVKRAALVASMDITSDGSIENINIEQAWIKSRHKLSYNQVTSAILNNEKHVWSPQITKLKHVYDILIDARIKRGALPIRSGDTYYKLNPNGKILQIEHKSWHLAYGLVEECMLATNTAVSQWMIENKLPGMYRHHKGPDPLALEEKKEFFEALGIELNSTPSIMELSVLATETKDTEHEAAVENVIRSTMKAATYITDQTSHFSLAYEWYTHFTSPLRRYADFTIHRIIKSKLNNTPIPELTDVSNIAEICTTLDKRAKVATRSEEKRLKVQYAEQFIGQTVKGAITGGTPSLVFVKSAEIGIEGGGKLPMNWTWNKNSACLKNDAHNQIRIGSEISTTLTNIDTLKWKIELNPHLELPLDPIFKIDY